MSTSLLRGGTILTVGQAVTLAISLLRNLFIAKLIGEVNFGVGGMFAVTMTAVELASDVGVQKQVIQSKQADEPSFLATAHSLSVLRGFLVAFVIFLFARPSALWFDVPEATWAFQLLPLVPLGRAFINLDIFRQHRELNFRPYIYSEIASQAAALLVGISVALQTRSYDAVLYAILTQSFVSATSSHFLTSAPFRFGWDRQHVGKMISYGWPLMFSGLLMILGTLSDRFIIGPAFGALLFGNYELVIRLTNAPMLGLTKVLNGLVLPILSKHESSTELEFKYSVVTRITATIAGLFAVICLFVLPRFIELFYQNEYGPAVNLAGVVGVLMAVRLIRIVPAQAQLALADTKGLLVANICRGLAISIVAFVAFQGVSIETAVMFLIMGEILALGCSIMWLWRFRNIPVFPAALPHVFAILSIGCLFAVDRLVFECKFALGWFVFGILLALLLITYLGVNLMHLRNTSENRHQLTMTQPATGAN